MRNEKELVDDIMTEKWEFEFHYGVEPEEIYLPAHEWHALCTLFVSPRLDTFLGMKVYLTDGERMFIHRKDNASFRYMNRHFDHAVTDMEEEVVALWRETPIELP